MFGLMFVNFLASGLEQSEIDAIQELEQTSRNDTLLKYHDICIDEGVSALPTS